MSTLEVTLAIGVTSDPILAIKPETTITAVPGGGGSVSVEYSTSTEGKVTAGTANWQTWPAGSVTATTSDTLIGKITAIRATALVAIGLLEVRN